MASLARRIEAAVAARVIWLVPRWRRRVLARELRTDHFQPRAWVTGILRPAGGAQLVSPPDRAVREATPGTQIWVTGTYWPPGGAGGAMPVTPPPGAETCIAQGICPWESTPLDLATGLCPLCGVTWRLHAEHVTGTAQPAWKSRCRFCRAYIERGLAGWVAPAEPDPFAPCPASPDTIHYEYGEEIHGQPDL